MSPVQERPVFLAVMSANVEEATNLILDCITSVKLWIQHQIVIPRGFGEEEDDDEEVVISLTSKNPQQITKTVHFNYNTREFQTKTLRFLTYS